MLKFRNSPIRQLARSTYWQNLYSRAKELHLNLFENTSDLSKIQITFLYFLEIYNSIYTDIAMGDCVMTYEKLESDIITDAYLTYKRFKTKNRDKKGKNKKRPINSEGSMIFRGKKGDK